MELNTIASSFGSLSAKITAMHKHLLPLDHVGGQTTAALALTRGGTIPENDALAGMARGICFAHKEYLKVISRGRELISCIRFIHSFSSPVLDVASIT